MATTPIPEPTVTDIPVVSPSTGSWLFADHIDDDHKAALMRMAGLTVEPDIIHVNGNVHIIEQIDNNQV